MTPSHEWAKTVRHIFSCAAVVITAWQAPVVPLGILAAGVYLVKTLPKEEDDD